MRIAEAEEIARKISESEDGPELADLYDRAQFRGLPAGGPEALERNDFAPDASVFVADCEDGDVIVEPSDGGYNVRMVVDIDGAIDITEAEYNRERGAWELDGQVLHFDLAEGISSRFVKKLYQAMTGEQLESWGRFRPGGAGSRAAVVIRSPERPAVEPPCACRAGSSPGLKCCTRNATRCAGAGPWPSKSAKAGRRPGRRQLKQRAGTTRNRL